jgi:putative endonuclease
MSGEFRGGAAVAFHRERRPCDRYSNPCQLQSRRRIRCFDRINAMVRARNDFAYILASKRKGTLYTGVTNDLRRCVYEHRSRTIDGFTRQYGVERLVWFEVHRDVRAAICREKIIKGWRREWKLYLIEETNRYWDDLYKELT